MMKSVRPLLPAAAQSINPRRRPSERWRPGCPEWDDSPQMWFSPEIFVLTLAQAACIVVTGAGVPAWAERFQGRAWVLVLPLSIVVVIGAIAAFPGTADLLTWLALFGVPAGAALAFGWAGRGARPWLALAMPPLLAIAWAWPTPPRPAGGAAADRRFGGDARAPARRGGAAGAAALGGDRDGDRRRDPGLLR